MDLIKNLKIFHLFIFGKIREESVFDNILERKKAFLDYKKQKVKKKNFGQNFEIFQPFYFLQNQRQKCV